MTIALAVLEVLLLVAVIALLLRRRETKEDPRLTALAAELPTQFARLEARLAAVDEHIRSNIAQFRADSSAEAQAGREAAERSAAALRSEVLGSVQALGTALREGLDSFRTDNARGSEALRNAVDERLGGLTQRFMGFSTDMALQHAENRDALTSRLTELGNQYAAQQEKLRSSVEERLEKLNLANAAKLEEMRQTVDEKLHATLQTRLTESFGQVTDQLTKVHAGLGEMNTLAAGVGDLKKVLSNVKSRGIVGEYFLGQQLEQMFSADQYIANARIKPGTQESVEFALKVPNGPDSTVLLALDSKFPVGDWERLEEAYESGDEDERRKAGVAFERAIRTEAKRICDKYIDPPNTLPFAIMYLPTEALYAEVMRRPGLHAEVQSQCNVVMAGPSAFTMILTSFQLVFRTLKFQKNLNQVWEVFQVAQKEFEKFGGLMEKVEGQVGTVQRTLKEISGKTKTVNRAFRNASRLELAEMTNGHSSGLLPLVAAEDDD